MENKYLQIRKENIFTKFINFIKGIFGNKKEKEVNPQPEMIKPKETSQSNFLDELRLYKEEDPVLLKLQNQFEKNEIDLCVMSNEEVHELNALYKRQVSELKKKLDNKKTELSIMQHKIKSYSANI